MKILRIFRYFVACIVIMGGLSFYINPVNAFSDDFDDNNMAGWNLLYGTWTAGNGYAYAPVQNDAMASYVTSMTGITYWELDMAIPSGSSPCGTTCNSQFVFQSNGQGQIKYIRIDGYGTITIGGAGSSGSINGAGNPWMHLVLIDQGTSYNLKAYNSDTNAYIGSIDVAVGSPITNPISINLTKGGVTAGNAAFDNIYIGSSAPGIPPSPGDPGNGTLTLDALQYVPGGTIIANGTLTAANWNEYRYQIEISYPDNQGYDSIPVISSPFSKSFIIPSSYTYGLYGLASLQAIRYSDNVVSTLDTVDWDLVANASGGGSIGFGSNTYYIGGSDIFIEYNLINPVWLGYTYSVELLRSDGFKLFFPISSGVSNGSYTYSIQNANLPTGIYTASLVKIQLSTGSKSLIDSDTTLVEFLCPNCLPGVSGSVWWNQSSYDLYDDFYYSWNIQNIDWSYMYSVRLLSRNTNSFVATNAITRSSGSDIFRNFELQEPSKPGWYMLVLVQEDLQTYSELAQSTDMYYGINQSLSGNVSGNFTITNSPVMQGTFLNVTYNISATGKLVLKEFGTGFQWTTYISKGTNQNIQIYIPTNFNTGASSLSMYYTNSNNVDVLLFWQPFTVYSKLNYSLRAAKSSYMQGEYLDFYAWSTESGYVSISRPDGNIVQNIYITPSTTYTISYQSNINDPIGIYTAQMYNMSGYLVATALTNLTVGSSTPIPTVSGTPTPTTTLPPGGIPGGSGVSTSGCPTSGSSLLDIGGIIGCVTFGKLETDDAGDLKNSPQNRMIGYNGLYTLMLIVLVIFVMGTYKKIKGR